MTDTTVVNRNVIPFESKKLSPLKYTHIASSVILILLGIIAIIGSLCIRENLYYYEQFLKNFINIPTLGVLVAAVITIAFGWLGIIAVWQDYYRGILTFSVLVSLLFIAIIISWITLYFSVDSFDEYMVNSLKYSMEQYHFEKKNMDILQTKLQCCGMTTYRSWTQILAYIPGSCCESKEACDYTNGLHEIHKNDCVYALRGLMYYHTVLLFIAVVITEGALVLSLSLSYFLCRALKQEKEHRALSARKEEVFSMPNNPLAQASAPERDRSNFGNFINVNGDNKYLDHNQQNRMYNFWTPVTQDYA